MKNKYNAIDSFVHHKFFLLSLIISSLCLIAVSYYCVGVVELDNMSDIVDVRIKKLTEAAEENIAERDLVFKQQTEDCEYKAKSIAVMISQNPSLLKDEIGLEEILAVTGIDEITITDADGKVVHSTTSDYDVMTVEESFSESAGNKNFSMTKRIDREGTTMLVSGVSRRDADGIVSIVCSTSILGQIENYTDISKVTSRFPLLEGGITAIIDESSMLYLSHTKTEYAGTETEIDSSHFKGDRGSFFAKYNDEKCFVKYEKSDGMIILAAVPKSEVYSGRNRVFGWLVMICLISSVVATLAARKGFLDRKKGELND